MCARTHPACTPQDLPSVKLLKSLSVEESKMSVLQELAAAGKGTSNGTPSSSERLQQLPSGSGRWEPAKG